MTTMNKKIAGLMALTMVATMSPMTVFAADETTSPATGNMQAGGTFEGTVDTDVFCVVLPTNTAGSIDFKMDPECLIDKTSGGSLGSGVTTQSDNALYFTNTGSSGTPTYSSTSDALTIINKSSIDVDVTVTATLADFDGITLTDDNTFTDDTSASLYLALTDGATSSPQVSAITQNEDKTVKEASINAKIAGTPSKYEYKYASGTYSYAIKSGVTDNDFSSYSFYLTGATNSDGDWSNLSTIAPKATIAWTVKEHVDSYLTGTQMTSTNLSFPIASGAPEIKSVMLTSSILTTPYDIKSLCTITSTALTFNEYLKDHKGGTITVTFDGGATETITIA